MGSTVWGDPPGYVVGLYLIFSRQPSVIFIGFDVGAVKFVVP